MLFKAKDQRGCGGLVVHTSAGTSAGCLVDSRQIVGCLRHHGELPVVAERQPDAPKKGCPGQKQQRPRQVVRDELLEKRRCREANRADDGEEPVGPRDAACDDGDEEEDHHTPLNDIDPSGIEGDLDGGDRLVAGAGGGPVELGHVRPNDSEVGHDHDEQCEPSRQRRDSDDAHLSHVRLLNKEHHGSITVKDIYLYHKRYNPVNLHCDSQPAKDIPLKTGPAFFYMA